MTTRAVFLTGLVCASLSAGAADRIQLIQSARLVASAPDGGFYLTEPYNLQPTPGAYLTRNSGGSMLARFTAQGTLNWATYVDFYVSSIDVDDAGRAVMGGYAYQNFEGTPGAYQRPVRGRERLVAARMNASGSAYEFAAVLGGSADYAGTRPKIAVAANGLIAIAGGTSSADFPVTPDALRSEFFRSSTGGNGFLSVLSADGSILIYSTFLGDSFAGITALAADRRGGVHVAGYSAFNPGFTVVSVPAALPATFLARWNSGSRKFDYIGSLGPVGIQHLAADDQGRAVIAALDDTGVSPRTPGSLHSKRLGNTLIAKFDHAGANRFVTDIGTFGSLSGIAVDSDGNVIVAGTSNDDQPPLVTLNSPLLAGTRGSTNALTVLKLRQDGRRLLYATPVKVDYAFSNGFDYSGGVVRLAHTNYSLLKVHEPVEAIAEPAGGEPRTAIYTFPNVIDRCGTSPFTYDLIWDTRDHRVESVEVHAGAPDGPLVAEGLSGALRFTRQLTGHTYYLQDTTRGLPLTPANTLAVETVRADRMANRCSAVPDPEVQLRADPNPVLACSTGLAGGTETWLGIEELMFMEIRLLSPDGPLFAYGPRAKTGDWVGNGMLFFAVTRPERKVVGAERVYILPIRDCSTDATPPPALQATPKVIHPCPSSKATLAWHAGEYRTIEIREGSPEGRTVFRSTAAQGLVDVKPDSTLVYWLVGYAGARWVPLASETVTTGGMVCLTAP